MREQRASMLAAASAQKQRYGICDDGEPWQYEFAEALCPPCGRACGRFLRVGCRGGKERTFID